MQQSYNPRTYWCHLCKKEFEIRGEQIQCSYCQGEFCEMIEDPQNDPRIFVPFGLENQSSQHHQQSHHNVQIQQHQTPTTIIHITSIRNTAPIVRNIFFDNLLATMFPNSNFQTGQTMEQLVQFISANYPNRHGTPPASNESINNLKQITSPSQPCQVCQDDFIENKVALQLPCNHHFHPDCILPWLNLHNSCPVCRFELATDDQDYENRRLQKN